MTRPPCSTRSGTSAIDPGVLPGCYVIGSYWAAHHRFAARLGAVDRRFVTLTVVYLAFVALLPFPTGVLGEFSDNPISMVAFATNMAAVSAMEAVFLRHARRQRTARRP